MSKPRRYGRRANNEGTLFKRKSDGRWCAQVTLPSGTRKTLYAPKTNNTRAEAARLLAEHVAAANNGRSLASSRTTVDQFAADWLESVKARCRYKTYLTYRGHVSHISDALGRKRLDALTPSDLEALYSRLLKQGLASTSVHGTHRVVRTMLRTAYRYGLMDRDIASLANSPGAKRKDIVILTEQQANRFIACCDNNRYGVLFMTLLMAGLRVSEALALSETDLDLDKDGPTVTIRHSMTVAERGVKRADTKTDAGQRTVPLEAGLAEALRLHLEEKRSHPIVSLDRLVFMSSGGRPVNYSNLLRRYFIPLKQAAGLPDQLNMHHLRHFFGSWLLSQGLPLPVVSRMLGHSSVAVTARIYSHQIDKDVQRVATGMAALRVTAV